MYPVFPWNFTFVHSPLVPSFFNFTPASTFPRSSPSVLAVLRTLQISFVFTVPLPEPDLEDTSFTNSLFTYPVSPWNFTLVQSPSVPSFFSSTPISTFPRSSPSVLGFFLTLQISFVLTVPVDFLESLFWVSSFFSVDSVVWVSSVF